MERKLHIVSIFTLTLIWVMIPQTGTFGATTNQISQFGITWTFDGEYEYGQFANGDYWVVGPVTIIAINPPSIKDPTRGRIINGAMIDPVGPGDIHTSNRQGFDSSLGSWDSTLNFGRPNGNDLSAGNPLIIGSGHSLISAISSATAGAPLTDAAILTILGSAPPTNSFRPPYAGTDKTIKFNVSDLDYSRLASLPPVASTPRLEQLPDDKLSDSVERAFERPWLSWQTALGGIHPSNNMPGYGTNMAKAIGTGLLSLNLNYSNAKKQTLMIRLVQLGIDFYGVLANFHRFTWRAEGGGFNTSHKLPIVFAAASLNDAEMITLLGKTGDYLYSNGYGAGHEPPDYYHISEDNQTFYVTGHPDPDSVWTFNGSYWVSDGTDEDYDIYVPNPDPSLDPNPGNFNAEGYRKHYSTIQNDYYYGHGGTKYILDTEEFTNQHLGLPEWAPDYAQYPQVAGANWGIAYRATVGEALCSITLPALIMDLKTLWNHDAIFDYTDRWMEVMVGEAARSGTQFSEDMWDTYRADYGPIWTISPRLTISAVNGTVKKSPDKPAYELGETVTLEAIPDSGYRFVGWWGDLLDTGNPGKILMYANLSVTANFAPLGPTNEPPIANAGTDKTVRDRDGDGNEQVILDGSASFDPDGTIVSYVWTEDGKHIATGVKPTVTLSTGTHLITLTVTDNGGLTDTDTVTIKVLRKDEEFGKLPTGCYNNVINPLKGEKATIIVETKERCHIKIVLYDIKGNKIREVADEEKEAGKYPYSWNGKNDSGDTVGSGLYFVHMKAGDYRKTKKIVVVK